MTAELTTVLAGAGMCLALIVSIGAQNAFVLRQGIRREHVGLVVLFCVVSDAILQTIGVAGFGSLILAFPWIAEVGRWAAAACIVTFGIISLRRAIRGGGSLTPASAPAAAGAPQTCYDTRKTVLLTVFAVTWLNPHALIETTVLLGSVAATYDAERWWFLIGGIAASTLWFIVFGYGARLLAPLMRTERAWRILDGAIAAVMFAIAAKIILS